MRNLIFIPLALLLAASCASSKKSTLRQTEASDSTKSAVVNAEFTVESALNQVISIDFDTLTIRRNDSLTITAIRGRIHSQTINVTETRESLFCRDSSARHSAIHSVQSDKKNSKPLSMFQPLLTTLLALILFLILWRLAKS